MDVHCSTCGEPWGVYHLRHDAIFDEPGSDCVLRRIGFRPANAGDSVTVAALVLRMLANGCYRNEFPLLQFIC